MSAFGKRIPKPGFFFIAGKVGGCKARFVHRESGALLALGEGLTSGKGKKLRGGQFNTFEQKFLRIMGKSCILKGEE